MLISQSPKARRIIRNDIHRYFTRNSGTYCGSASLAVGRLMTGRSSYASKKDQPESSWKTYPQRSLGVSLPLQRGASALRGFLSASPVISASSELLSAVMRVKRKRND